MKTYPPLNREQQKMVADHFYVAERIAKKWYYGPKDTGDLEIDDLTQAGCWGMCKAVTRFKPEMGDLKGYLWSSAYGAVWHEVRDRSRTVRPPQAYLNWRGEIFRLHRLQGLSVEATVENLQMRYPRKHRLFTAEFVTGALASYKSETIQIDDLFGLSYTDNWLTKMSLEYGITQDELLDLVEKGDENVDTTVPGSAPLVAPSV